MCRSGKNGKFHALNAYLVVQNIGQRGATANVSIQAPKTPASCHEKTSIAQFG